MKQTIINKLDNLNERHLEIAGLLAEPEVMADQNQFRKLSMEYSQLEPVVKEFQLFQQANEDQQTAKEMLNDPEMKEMAQEELNELKGTLELLELNLQKLLLPKDPHDGSNTFLEIRAGTGGDEAALFAGDLFRMYSRLAEKQGWKIEIIFENG